MTVMMIHFQSIKQHILEMEYGFNRPKSLVVLIPGVSLIFLQIQASALRQTLNETYTKLDELSALSENPAYAKLDTIHTWHALGSLAQVILLLFLSTFHPLCLIPAAFSFYELYSSSRGVTREVVVTDGKLHIKS